MGTKNIVNGRSAHYTLHALFELLRICQTPPARDRHVCVRRGLKSNERLRPLNRDPAVSNRLCRAIGNSRRAPHRRKSCHRPSCTHTFRRTWARPRTGGRAIPSGYCGDLRGTRLLSQQPRGNAAGREAPRSNRCRSQTAFVTHATRGLMITEGQSQ